MSERWRSCASVCLLKMRAQMFQDIRAFFIQRQVLEVETPVLSSAGGTDPEIESLSLIAGNIRYLHTSPEFAMKRLLASGSGDIYQICKVFRNGEAGRYHNPEFTLLEWYRLGLDQQALSNEVVELIGVVAGRTPTVVRYSYQALFEQGLGLNPLIATTHELKAVADERNVAPASLLSHDGYLDLLMSLCLMPALPHDQITLVENYPASQASLSRLNPGGATAARFELFWGSIELANGFHELTDAKEQRKRFEAENDQRRATGIVEMPVDQNLLSALEAGLPDCAGVALGLDRLLMKLAGARHIDEVIAFPFERA